MSKQHGIASAKTCGRSRTVRYTVRLRVFQILAGLLLIALASCRLQEPETKYKAMSGTIDRINLRTGEVTFRFLHEKSGQYREHRAWLLPETEILINGRLSKLSDIKVGERVSPIWRIEQSGKRRRITALKIRIARDESHTVIRN